MASNSSAAAVAALFGIRDGDHQDQIKPLLAQQQQQHQQPPAAPLNAASSSAGSSLQATAAPPPVKKKRNLPDPDAEVIALSPKTLLATNRFVCEVCNKGFQREQNLQLHRRGHNLPWKLKQKDPAQMQRRRVYLCPEPTCAHHDPARALGDLTGIKKHFCRKHGEKKWKCDKCSKRYAVQSDWKAHSKICGTREYRCDCGTLFSRRDSFITHRAFCDALAQESARLPPTGLTASHLYGATSAANMALSLSQVGSHLASTLGADAHGHHQDLLLLGGGGAAIRGFDHLLGPSSASAFRSLTPPAASAFLMGAPQDFGDGDGGNGSHRFLQGKPFNGLMHLPDLQGNGAGGPPASSAPGLFNLGYIANSANSSGASSHGHASQGHMTIDQFSEGGGGGGGDSESSAAMLFGGGGNFAGGDHQVAPGGMYNEQAVMLPQMSATTLLQKASQMGSTTSAHGGAPVFGGLVGSSAPSAPHGRASMVDQSQMHLRNLMNSLAGCGMFGGSNGGGMIDPRLYDMDHKVKFSQGRGDADMTRDFLGVGGSGIMRGMPVARGEHHDGAADMSSLEAEMKSASSSFTGGRMQ
ncbi:protein indeterminate-domain 6, chloroplastic-like [Phragmites australis]|uniref:protein indeterminate-domain 6, chloroplastic-like n=1 Tax=Phragmites australis TaxID=29695 RepID=UPI002D79F004|nr:protein indeterminate-domain 6, chloroplastic-like [Phragmites australis]